MHIVKKDLRCYNEIISIRQICIDNKGIINSMLAKIGFELTGSVIICC